MKTMHRSQLVKLTTMISVSGALVLSAQVSSAASKGYCGYVTSSTGELVRDSDGHCVRGGSWEPKFAIEECDPQYIKKAEPQQKPAPKPVAKVMPEPEPKPVIKTIELKAGALFDTNSDNIKSLGYPELDKLSAELKKNTQYENFKVIGHTDSRGKDNYNLELSKKRASAVRDYLVSKGINGDRITVIGMGERQPIADNQSAEGRAKNRRVEIQVKVIKVE